MPGISINRPSPVALFAYNRPEMIARSLESLAKNGDANETGLTVFCDGPRTAAEEKSTKEVQACAREAKGFRSVRVVTREQNLGSAVSIRTGLDQMFEEHRSVIVLEDDFTTSVHFLRFMNNALRFYEAEDRVASVCGYSPLGVKTSADTYFLPGAHCWGWAAWRRSWSESEHNPRKVLQELDRRNLIFDFDAAGAEPCTLLLHRAVQEQRESWVLPWMASAILMHRLSVFPARSLVRNGGLDKTGLPIEWLRILMPPLADYCPEVEAIPILADEKVLRFVRWNLIRLRFGDSRLKMLYNRVMKTLPNAVRRSLYSARVRHAMKSFGT